MPTHRVSPPNSESVRGVKDAWMLLLPLAGITCEHHDKLSKQIGVMCCMALKSASTYCLLRCDAVRVIRHGRHVSSLLARGGISLLAFPILKTTILKCPLELYSRHSN